MREDSLVLIVALMDAYCIDNLLGYERGIVLVLRVVEIRAQHDRCSRALGEAAS